VTGPVPLDPALGYLLTAPGVLLFACAAREKWRARAAFHAVLDGYRLLPAATVAPLTWLVPLVETLVAARRIINSREHFESLFEAERRSVASLQDYLEGRSRQGLSQARTANLK